MATAEHELASVLDAFSHTGAPDQSHHTELAEQFDAIYRQAEDDASLIPWHRAGANPPLVAWLDAEAPTLIRPGASVVVVGCGLGDDVAELARRGYDAIGFDICPTAIEWAKKRHSHLAESFTVADAINPPHSMLRRFDLIIEIYTIQAMPIDLRADAARGIASLLRPHGTMLVVCRGRECSAEIDESEGIPYPISQTELRSFMADQGLRPTREIDDFMDGEDPPRHRLRAAFRHA